MRKLLPFLSSLLLGSLQPTPHWPLEGGALFRGRLPKVATWSRCDFTRRRLSTAWPWPQAHCPTPPSPQKSLQGVGGLAPGPVFVPRHIRECRQGEMNIKCPGRPRFASWPSLGGSDFFVENPPVDKLIYLCTLRNPPSHH